MPADRGAVRRRRLLDAAVDVVAAGGLRGLTHRAVDAQAELPEGTTSAYYRTRIALLSALADHVAAKVSTDVDVLAARLSEHVGDHDYAIAQTQRLIESWLKQSKMLATRLELGLEAARQPEIAETLSPWRAHLLDVISERMCQVGLGDVRLRAETVVSALDGVLMAALAIPPAQRRSFASNNTRLLLESLLSQPDISPS